jgi:hypothetical protein
VATVVVVRLRFSLNRRQRLFDSAFITVRFSGAFGPRFSCKDPYALHAQFTGNGQALANHTV